MIPRSTRRFLCFFLALGCLMAVGSTSLMPDETLPATLRQLSPDSNAPADLRRAEAAKNGLVPVAWFVLSIGLVLFLVSERRKRQEPSADPKPK